MNNSWADEYARAGITREDVAFHRRLTRPVVYGRVTSRERFVMNFIAHQSGALEGAAWDQWDLHSKAILNAYQTGLSHERLALHHMTRWHRSILPYGGCLRSNEPVSLGMGESFKPAPHTTLPKRLLEFSTSFCDRLDAHEPFFSLAALHFEQWQIHFWPDGNKRLSRLMTVYGCGWFDLSPVCITLGDKHVYLDCLQNANVTGLARLFEARLVEW
jgi:hypothetical protein